MSDPQANLRSETRARANCTGLYARSKVVQICPAEVVIALTCTAAATTTGPHGSEDTDMSATSTEVLVIGWRDRGDMR